ncbi:uncharacterized protein LOC127286284 [Leptopilina boulardi]|uniref:uncharacterized protein LOC127286284 n=1 Tax=Leptopilina boulardi TaxID=63433 RepID=UPI0021F5A758|nr:uncharacterized protein LOC127286284 [Leptopilina boulardi]
MKHILLSFISILCVLQITCKKNEKSSMQNNNIKLNAEKQIVVIHNYGNLTVHKNGDMVPIKEMKPSVIRKPTVKRIPTLKGIPIVNRIPIVKRIPTIKRKIEQIKKKKSGNNLSSFVERWTSIISKFRYNRAKEN